MSEQAKQKKAKEPARKGFWIESGEAGESLFCFSKRDDGKKRIFRFTLKQIEREMKKDAD